MPFCDAVAAYRLRFFCQNSDIFLLIFRFLLPVGCLPKVRHIENIFKKFLRVSLKVPCETVAILINEYCQSAPEPLPFGFLMRF
jgi:hypothetical protein